MNISQPQRQSLVDALNERLHTVNRLRKEDAENVSSKWNDSREAMARRLDQERDEILSLLDELETPGGSFAW